MKVFGLLKSILKSLCSINKGNLILEYEYYLIRRVKFLCMNKDI